MADLGTTTYRLFRDVMGVEETIETGAKTRIFESKGELQTTWG